MRSRQVTEGKLRAPHRSLFKALGLTDREMELPKVGVVNSFNEVVPGHMHLKMVAESVKSGIRLGGGVPMEVNTIAVCDGIAMNHEGMRSSLPTREIIADSIEASATAMPFDALVFIPSCDKVVPGMLMAAARLNLPSVFVSGGPMLAGRVGDRRVALTDVFEAAGRDGSEEELAELENEACPTCGSCAGMYTANTMNCMTEALGVALKGNGTVPAVYSKRLRLGKESGIRVMELLEEKKNIGEILTREAFENAVAVDMALGGSTNTALHLPAIAYEAGVDLRLDDFHDLSQRVKQIVKLSPAGRSYIEDLDRAGGIYGVMSELHRNNLIKGTPTIYGEDIKLEVEEVSVRDREVIRGFDNPHYNNGGLAVLKGNLAPKGSIVKSGAVDERMLIHRGPAKVYDCEEDAVEALLNKEIVKGDVIVIRYEGPKGGPGMREMLSPTSVLVGMGLDSSCALITDGRFSGGSKGAAIGHVSPEAREGGNIALVRDGDMISVDIPGGRIDVEVDEEELERRREKLVHPHREVRSRFLKKYMKLVSSASEGAVMSY
ncbi:dihydroxy-acid dehydratase [Propionigenium maris DSM 9537]|uniref:Dihydroxy-acid dehydratase n=1 Tax=Propionigenium maris DSM 9537 TaxID=1123000 RepID=A0A9W6GLV1_9FUSO|nr:dihydroxy-acid dehydratase [Propionigenium maris]GLI56647.1 dihydroxy-acid dehydratase [Propionigenium maris DSM 9537]